MNIQLNQVFKSYNGKSGCMCGCNGNYKLPTHTPIVDANLEIGYEGYDEQDVSDRSVQTAIRKVNAALNFVGPHPRHVEVGYDSDCAFYDDGNRNTVVYFRDPINERLQEKRLKKIA